MNDIYTRKPVRVPVKLVDGDWEYFYGGPLPVKNDAVADLILDESSIEDKDFIEKFKRKSRHKLLDIGTELLVALTVKQKPKLDKKLSEHLILQNSPKKITLGTPYFHILRSPYTKFIKIEIGEPTDRQKATDPKAEGGIWLDLQGLQPKGVITSSINLPDGVSIGSAISLNHAFTILSEIYEPWRKSHTGNIYHRILYQEKNKRWYPIEVLRNTAIVKDEHQLIKEQWEEILEKLNLKLKLINKQA